MKAVLRQLKQALVDLYWRGRGGQVRVPVMPVSLRSVLFVCKGNICRSPFAEYVARKIQQEEVEGDVQFSSAGLHVLKPIAPPQMAIQVGREFGVDLDGHRSQSISLNLVKSNDMIVAMEVWQYEALQSLYPQYHEKLFLLPLLEIAESRAEYGSAAFNISDPYGGSRSDFERCFERIRRCLRSFQAAVKSRAVEHSSEAHSVRSSLPIRSS